MSDFLAYELFPVICNMSLTASVVILAVLLARLALRRAPKVFSYALWAVVLFRLLCPVSISSAVSLLGALDAPVKERSTVTSVVEYVPSTITREPITEITRPVPAVSDTTGTLIQNQEQTTNHLEPLVGLMTLTWAAGITALLVYSLASLFRLKRRLVGGGADAGQHLSGRPHPLPLRHGAVPPENLPSLYADGNGAGLHPAA